MFSMKSMKGLIFAGLLGLTGVLAGCGGGGAGGGTTTPGGTTPGGTTTSASVTGTAATGKAMAAATITVKDANGVTVGTTTSAANGTFTLSVANATSFTSPFMLRADPTPANPASGDEHYSFLRTLDTVTAANNHVDITPATSLVLFEATKTNLATVFANASLYSGISDAVLSQARTTVVGKFPVLNGIDNFFDQTFSANGTDAYDAALDSLDLVTISFSGNTPTLRNSAGTAIPYDATTPLYPITSVTVSAGSAQMVADGASFNLIAATVTNSQGAPAKGVTINFTTTAGSIYDSAKAAASSSALTDASGIARVYLKPGTLIGSATVRAESSDNAASGSTTVQFVAGASAVVGLSATPSSVFPAGSSTLTAFVTDANGNVVANGETVTFKKVTSPGVEVIVGSQTTTSGYATLAYTAGNTAGTETLKAYTANGTNTSTTLTVSSAASAVTSLVLTSASNSLVADGGNSTTTLSATAHDSSGNGVSGAVIVFSSSSGCVFTSGACGASASASTNANGVATATLKSGALVLTAITSASVNGISANHNVSFTAGVATVVGLNAAPSSVKPNGTSTLTVSVLDNSGNAIANEPITLSICTQANLGCSTTGSGNPSLSAVTGTTNANGLLLVTYTAGANNGTDTVRVITSNGVVKAANIGINSSNAVVGSVTATATNPSIPVTTGSTVIRATVRDTAGQVLPGVTVDFTASAGYLGATGTSTTASAATDANGIASVTLRAGDSVQTAKVEAVTNGFASIASVNYVAGVPNMVTVTAAPTAVKPGGTSALTVLVTDASGNPVPGETVALLLKTIHSGAPTLSTLSGTTNANGITTLTYTAGANTATDPDTIQATSSNGKTGTVAISVDSANAVVGSVALVSVNSSIAVKTATQLHATLLDTVSQPIVGRTVSFTTSTGTFGAVGTAITTTTAVTDANGVATVTLTAGSAVVTANVSASVSGYTSSTTVNFTAGAATFVTVIPAPDAVQPSGTSTLTVLVQDNDHNAIVGENVALAITTIKSGAPSLNIASGLTNSSGLLTLTYTAGATSAALPDIVTATASNGVSGTAAISVNGGNAVIASVSVAATSSSIPITGQTVIRATVLDTAGRLVPGITVHFDTGAGSFGGNPSIDVPTDANGVASATLTAGSTVLTAQIRASTSGFTSSTSVNFTAGTAAAVSISATPNILQPQGTSTITVAVVDSSGNAVANEPVTLSLPKTVGIANSGNPSLSATTGGTDANGLLTVTYTAGTDNGMDQVKAVVSTGFNASKTITVAAGTPTIGSLTLGVSNASVPVVTGSSVIRALVKDNTGAAPISGTGNPIPGLTVNFSIRSGGGTLSAVSAVTDNNGVASVTLTGTTINVPQAVRIDAEVGGFNRSATVDFVADNPSAISLIPTPNKVKPLGSATLVAAVADAEGNPVANEKVTLSIKRDSNTGLSPSGASMLSGASGSTTTQGVTGTTDANGLLTVTYTAGSNGGVGISDVIRAVASNGKQPTATYSMSVDANNIVIGSVSVSSANSSLVVGGDTTTIRATVRDIAGVVVPNYLVTFKTTAGAIANSATTDSNGLATATLTSGTQILTATITATAGGVLGTTTVGFTADVPDTVLVSAAPSTVTPGVSSTISAYVVDANLNPVVGETVTFSIPTKGSGLPSLALATAVTNANGLAVVTYTAGAGTGTDTVQAITSNVKSGTKNITVSTNATVVGSIALITGATTLPADGTSTTVLRATVRTSAGALASGVTVNFTASGGSLDHASATTDANGIAEVSLKSPSKTGRINITAEASGFLATQTIAIVAGPPKQTKFAFVASPTSVNAGGISTLTTIVLDTNDNPVVGETVTFTITTATPFGSISPVTTTTNSNGVATSTYTGGNALGTDTITATLVGGVTDSVSITIAGGTLSTLSIGTSATQIKSDNSTAATITVTALSSTKVVVPGITVTFSADGGQLSASQVVTNASGQAVVTLNSGTQNKSNRTVVVTAKATGATAVSIPIQVTGSTVQLTTSASTVTSGGAAATITVTAQDAGGIGLYNVPVALSQSGAGSLTITAASGTTDASGQFTTTVTGNAAGSATLTATTLDPEKFAAAPSQSVASASASQTFTILPNSTFQISSPANNSAMTTSPGSQVFIVTAPTQDHVRFATSIGTWTVCTGGVGVGTSVCTMPVVAGSASATISSSLAGEANIQVDGLTSGAVTGTDSHNLYITASTAATISLQSDRSNVQPSTGGSVNTATLMATVRDASGQLVGGIPVAFSILNTTGGGESISPVIKLSSDGTNSTDPLGQALTTFTSGSLPSGQGASSIRIKATALGSGVSDTYDIVVGGTAGSVAIGTSTTISSNGTTQYTMPMSVLVSDSNGNPVPAGTVVTLSAWPTYYALGAWRSSTVDGTHCVPTSGPDTAPLVDTNGDGTLNNDYFGVAYFKNEDLNRNLILDAGEDVSPGSDYAGAVIPADGILTPPNSAAGTLPASVVTDANGVANFNLVYLKQYAAWIIVEVTASTKVQGTEATNNVQFTLPALKTDADACLLPDSPFGVR